MHKKNAIRIPHPLRSSGQKCKRIPHSLLLPIFSGAIPVVYSTAFQNSTLQKSAIRKKYTDICIKPCYNIAILLGEIAKNVCAEI